MMEHSQELVELSGNDLSEDLIRLACPFHRHNPDRYQKCRACSGAGFLEFSRVKEHLKMVHGSRCPKCSFVFENEAPDEHLKRNPTCKYRRNDTIEYMTEKQWQQIEKMPRRGRGTSPGDQWKIAYGKLFGTKVRIPAPYLPSLEQYRRIAQRPPPELLGEMQRKIQAMALVTPYSTHFYMDENQLRLCLGLLIPTLFDLVSETGLVADGVTAILAPEQLFNGSMGSEVDGTGDGDESWKQFYNDDF